MSMKSFVICTCILLNHSGRVTADDRSLSTSSIIALSVLFGFIFLVSLFCLVCFSVRKYKSIKRKKKSGSSDRQGSVNTSFVETQITATELDAEKLAQLNNQSVDITDNTGEINSAFIEVEKDRKVVLIENSQSNIGQDKVIQNTIHEESNPDSQEEVDAVNPMLNVTPRDLENIERIRLSSVRSDSVDFNIDDNDYKDGLGKIIGDLRIKTEANKIVENGHSSYNEDTTDSPPKMVVQNNVVYTQASTEQVNTSFAPNGVGPQLQRYTDWRNGTVGTTQSMYVKNTSTINRSQVSDIRPRTRSISPSRYQQRTYERGRSVKRIAVPTQVVTQPYSSVRVVQPITRSRIRSRSAPPLRQMTYVTKVPEATTGYTRSHYLAIKQPFSKKFLLPPVKVSERFVPVGSQRVIVTKRPTVIQRPAPQPIQQDVIKGKVYHVQYNTQGTNTIARGMNALNLERTYSASTNNSGQNYYTDHRGQYVTRQTSNNSSQGIAGRAVYTNQLSYNSDVFESQGTGSRPTSQVIEVGRTEVVTTPRNGEADYIYSSVIKTTEKPQQNGNADEYTIVDYVENGTSAGKTTSPLSTSTPRFPERDTSALDDLDNVLGKSSSSSSSSDKNE